MWLAARPMSDDRPAERAYSGRRGARCPAGRPRDILAPFVLLAVSLQRGHGYVIEDYLRALGLFGITMSTLYRTLRQMEKDGYLESTWEPGPTGPARRVYTMTALGRTWLDSSAIMLDAYRDTIDRFFGLYGTGPAAAGRQDPGTEDREAVEPDDWEEQAGKGAPRQDMDTNKEGAS